VAPVLPGAQYRKISVPRLRKLSRRSGGKNTYKPALLAITADFPAHCRYGWIYNINGWWNRDSVDGNARWRVFYTASLGLTYHNFGVTNGTS
jgi:hypothetical protein